MGETQTEAGSDLHRQPVGQVSNERPELSLILPAFNEAARLPAYLTRIRSYLPERYGVAYEVIVVDDGSTDGLVEFLSQAGRDWPQLRWLQHAHNQGKGMAVRTGMLAAKGQQVLFADADGATPIEEERQLSEAIRQGADLAIGSRLLAATGARRSRAWLRSLAGRGFAWLARTALHLPVRDTQCGFKMFRVDVGQRLFSLLEEPGFFFDLELLARAGRLGYRIAEVPVNWHEVPGGHLHLARLLPRVLAALHRIRRRVHQVG
jgi:dolichyl-phosphate beta-glucosyltransferase